jgi:hypothetical protein
VASLWLSRAIQNATLIGCQPGLSKDVEPQLKRRLWWSILLRDRALSLGLRRRPQLLSLDFGSVPADPLEESEFQEEIAKSQVYDPATKRMLFRVLQEQCCLAVLLTEMSSFIFSTHGISAPLLSAEDFNTALLRLCRIKRSLQQWEVRSQTSSLAPKDPPEAVTLFINFTYMYY